MSAFLAVIIWPAYEYAYDESFVRTPALEIPNTWRAAAVWSARSCSRCRPLCVSCCCRRRIVIPVVVTAVLIAGAMLLAKPLFMSFGNWNLLIFFVFGIVATVFIGVPIAFAFGVMTVAYIAVATRAPMTIVISRMDEGMSHLILLSIPLFIFLGLLIEMTGMARAMVNFLASLLGHVRGGLSYVLLGAMILVSGISGAKAADMAAVGPVLFPEMKKRGAKPGELVSLLAASGAMAETIPPSLVLITIGSVTGVSIAALFTGGLLPGLVLAHRARRRRVLALGRRRPVDGAPRHAASEIVAALWISIPALILPFIIRSAVVEGVATATEVSTIGVAYTVIVGLLVYRQFDWRRLYPMLVDTASLSGSILLIVGTATAMAWALTQSGFSRQLAAAMAGVPGGAVGFMALSIVVFIVLGSVLEGIPALVLLAPLLFPIAKLMGIHEVHYAMVVILAMGIGLFAPPFGVGFFTACAIGRVEPDEAMGRIWPYLGALLVAVIVVAAIPWLSTGFL